MDKIPMYNITQQINNKKDSRTHRCKSISRKNEDWAVKIHESLINISDFDRASIMPKNTIDSNHKLMQKNYNSLLKTCKRSAFSQYIRK